MAVNLGTAYIQIQPSTKGLLPALKKGLGGFDLVAKDAGEAGGEEISKGMGSKVKGGMPKIGGMLKAGLVGLGLVAGAAIGKELMSGITGAAEAEQSRGGLAVIFEKDTKQMGKQAKEAATTMGLTEDAYNKLASGVGAIFKGQGMDAAKYTTDMLKRSADVAATFGGSTADAQEAMSAGMRGEYNALEKYGVVLTGSMVQQELVTRGQDKLTGAKLEAAKAEARYSLMMEQTKDTQGQFASESNTMAGQQERMGAQWDNLKTKIGEGFLPIITTVMSFISGTVLPGIESFVAGLKGGEGGVGAFVGVLRDNLMPIFSAVAGFVTGTLVPNIQLIAGIIWSTVKPAFDQLIGLLVTRVLPVLKDLANFLIINVLPVIKMVFEKVLIPVLKTLATVVTWVFNTIVVPVLKLAIAFLTDVLIPVFKWVFTTILIPVIKGFADTFTWLFDKVINPVGKKIGDTLTWLSDSVFKPVFSQIGGIIKTFGSAWADVWNGIQSAAARPVNFVIEAVWNNGLRKLIGMIPGVEEPGRVNPVYFGDRGSSGYAQKLAANLFAEGGWTGPGSKWDPAGVVHADEFVISKDSRRKMERNRPGLLDFINRNGDLSGYATGGRVQPVGRGMGNTYAGHTGRDWPAAIGTPVRAAGDGVITKTAKLASSYGWHIRQRLDEGFGAVYAHLSRIGVAAGQRVSAGQTIGAVGNTGNSTGPHLHFGINESPSATVGFLRGAKNLGTGANLSAGAAMGPDPELVKKKDGISALWETITGALTGGGLGGEWGQMFKGVVTDGVNSAFKYAVEKIPGLKTIMDGLNWVKGLFGGGKSDAPKGGYARGTSSARRGPAWVGEDGPEVVNFRGGEQVYTAKESAGLGGSVTIENISLPGVKNLQDLIEFLESLPESRRHSHMIGAF